jgi:hypothetical protein
VLDSHEELFRTLYYDRVLAHEAIFPHRHTNTTQDFHREMILDWHNPEVPKSLDMVFRGGAKSTIAEEAITLRAGFREFRNGLVIGETFERACERVHAIRREIETNDQLQTLFGDLRGPTWADGEIVLSNGLRIKALGRGQALRGIKFEDIRPDAVFCDDIETMDSVADKDRREKTRRWFFAELLPACDPTAFVRVAATPLDNDALAVRLTEAKGWQHKIYPIEYLDAEGVRKATWPDRFPLTKVDELRDTFIKQGMYDDFEREYMCLTRSTKQKTFRTEDIRVEPRVRTWQATYAMFDPARTTNAKSATTGYASWSWLGSKLVIWDAWGRQLLPNEIVDEIFNCATSTELPPVWIGVEEDGLNEFLLQPIRGEQVKRGVSIPFRALRAPKGKLDFIGALQPYFRAREVVFAKELPDLRDQLLGFPTGRIDVPNALAYALRLKPGAPIHDNFTAANVFEGLRRVVGMKPWLVVQTTQGGVGAALVQYGDGVIYVLADWFYEGRPFEVFPIIAVEARLEVSQNMTAVFPPKHFEKYSNEGIVQAARRVPMDVQPGTAPELGSPVLADMLARERKGFPAVRIASTAKWTLNGLAGGYCRYLSKGGVLEAKAESGPYCAVIEAIESFVGLTGTNFMADREDIGYDTTPTGRRYISARR